MERASTTFIAFGAFFVLVGGIWSGIGLTNLLQSNDQAMAQVSTQFLIVGVFVLGAGALLLFFGVRSVRWRPTAQELARQNPDDMRTWQFKPVGVVLFLALLTVFCVLGILVEQYCGIQGATSGLGSLFGLPLIALLSLRRVRSLIFYVEAPRAPRSANQMPRAKPPNHPLLSADPPRE